jgi:hypothetical protein
MISRIRAESARGSWRTSSVKRPRPSTAAGSHAYLLLAILLVGLFAVRAEVSFAYQDTTVQPDAAWQQLPPESAAQEQGSPGDFAIPGGAFFTQALPGRTDGVGFAVQDGHGARLWTAFHERGGVEALGYPISRRFEWEGRVAQAFERGILRWSTEAGEAELLSRSSLPGGTIPAYAVEPELPPIVAAELETKPWSGWWWPAADGIGPTLFAANGPLAKYDRYAELATGENPRTREWERQEVYYPGYSWAGHCNGWAAASLLEPEPTEPRELLGVPFTVGDQKGLLSAYHFADAAAWSHGEGGTVDPADLHRMLLTWLAAEKKGFVATFDLGNEEVWSYPVYAFSTTWGPDPEIGELWRVTTTLWMADPNVPTDFVGLKPYRGPAGQTFEYVLQGDPRNPSGGAWIGRSEAGRFAHPGRIWYPEPQVRNLERQLASPNLDRGTIAGIVTQKVEAAVAE